MIKQDSHGILFLVSAPSGAGKTTLCEKLLGEDDRLQYSVSCTTRPPREGEENGKHYHFISETDYAARVSEGAFLEHARVHEYGYGTLAKTVSDILTSGRDVLMDVDVQGAAQIRKTLHSKSNALSSHYTDIFIAPPSLDSLRERLVARGKDAADVVALRLENARIEMQSCSDYQYVVVNEVFDEALTALRAIVHAERCRNRAV